ncbi:nucleotide binding protein 1-like protein [Tieghemostelium lacteum]|uniref:Nucleotide binding protein 1-like protein n=1 Tax=Tieghemostelium lacteum TaxID=361077 RepID=A0A152A6I8_TIELA|nr:nucleotide binding protein 1-like protein [Tieghemostelium lacteum]|eukprot:KYR01820.1 nucleotide binding protein 1-like protein [Tieghemostelium lacteum]
MGKQCCGGSNNNNTNNSQSLIKIQEDSGCCKSNSTSTDSESSCCKSNSITSTTTSASTCCSTSKSENSSSCCKSSSSTTSSCSSDSKNSEGCCKQQNKSTSSAASITDPTFIISSEATEVKEDRVTTFKGCPSSTPQAGKESICSGCPGQGVCQSQGTEVSDEKKSIEIRMKPIKHKILVMSGKGGVGKSTVSSLLAYALASKSQKVSILDVDICGPSIPLLMGIQDQQIVNSEYGWIPPKSPGHEIKVMSVGSLLNSPDSPVIWKGPRKTTMIRKLLKDTYWGRQDYLIIDTPPGTSDEHLSIISALQSCNPDGAIIVTTPQDLSVDTVKKEIHLCQKLNLPILGIIENLSGFVCPCCNETTEIFQRNGKGGGEQLSKEYNIPYLGKIPIDQNLSTCTDLGKCAVCEHPETQGSLSILSILEKIMK